MQDQLEQIEYVTTPQQRFEVGDQLSEAQTRIRDCKLELANILLRHRESWSVEEEERFGAEFVLIKTALRSVRQERNYLLNRLGQNRKGEPLPGSEGRVFTYALDARNW